MTKETKGGAFKILLSAKVISLFGVACLAAVLYGELRASETSAAARYVPLYWLLSAYDNDQGRAKELYEGQRIVTRGIVADIDDAAGQGDLLLTTGPAPPLNFRGSSAEGGNALLASISEGSLVKIECTIGQPGEHLFAHDCAISKTE